MFDAVTAAGYTPSYVAREVDDDPLARAERRRQFKGLAVAALAMMQVMMFSLPLYVADADGHDLRTTPQLFRWSALVVYDAGGFLFGAAVLRPTRSLRSRVRLATAVRPGLAMDVPVALAMGAAYASSAAATITGSGEVYFDSVTMFVFLLSARAISNSRRADVWCATINWLALLPESARRESNGVVETIPLDTIRAGDRIVVPSGSRIAVDGDVVDGTTQVDEATLTGESCLVAKTVQVCACSPARLNVAQPITVVADERHRHRHASPTSTVSRNERRSTNRRVAVQADAIARHFVAVVLVIAFATFVFWHLSDPSKALSAAIAVLVVSCPCALSLATPDRDYRCDVGAAPARLSDYASARARTSGANSPRDLRQDGYVDGRRAGTRGRNDIRWLRRRARGGDCARAREPLEPCARRCVVERTGRTERRRRRIHRARQRHRRSRGRRAISPRKCRVLQCSSAAGAPGTVDLLSRCRFDATGRRRGRIRRSDGVARRRAATIAALARLGVDAEIATGDREAPTRAVAEALHIPYAAEVTPEGKLARVCALRDRGIDVAMVGDGINDVPGLAAAAVSIAPADGTDLARSQSDALLLATGIGGIARAHRGRARDAAGDSTEPRLGGRVQPDRHPARGRRLRCRRGSPRSACPRVRSALL